MGTILSCLRLFTFLLAVWKEVIFSAFYLSLLLARQSFFDGMIKCFLFGGEREE
jgi:hypothetical protein